MNSSSMFWDRIEVYILDRFKVLSEVTCFMAAIFVVCSFAASGSFASGVIIFITDFFAMAMEELIIFMILAPLFAIAAYGFVCSLLQAFGFRQRNRFQKGAMGFFAAIVMFIAAVSHFFYFFGDAPLFTGLSWFAECSFVYTNFAISWGLFVVINADEGFVKLIEKPLLAWRAIIIFLICITIYWWGFNAGWPEYKIFNISLWSVLAVVGIFTSSTRIHSGRDI